MRNSEPNDFANFSDSLRDVLKLNKRFSPGAKLTIEQLINDAPLPAIIHWDQYHFVVLIKGSSKNKLIIADPARGLMKLSKNEFLKHWISTTENETGKGTGTALLLEITPLFKQMDVSDPFQKQKGKIGWDYLLNYLKENKFYFFKYCWACL